MSLELVHAFGYAQRVRPATFDRRRFGVPIGGPFDRESYALAAVLGDESDVWELGLAAATFRCPATGDLAVVGAPVSVTSHGLPEETGNVLMSVGGGTRVEISAPRSGARVYVSFAARKGAQRSLAELPKSLEDGPIRLVPGPQSELFDLPSLAARTYQVGHASDRVGIRLDGAFQAHSIELPSEPACVGAIQVTGAGNLVILGPDGPTIGGYPKVGVVIDADLDRWAQLRPGQSVSFEWVDLEEARHLREQRRARLETTLQTLRLALGR